MRFRRTVICGLICLLAAKGSLAALKEAKSIEVPDLTTGAEVDKSKSYNLGATGLRGWIFTKPPTHMDSYQGRTTILSRQILVTHVGVKSPADGVMQIGDVILGVDGKPFDDDARKLFAIAIQRAESSAGKGDLNLSVWRAGKTQEIRLRLRKLGDYKPASPLHSAKAKLILDEACQALAKEGIGNDWAGPISALAMLASGKEEFMPVVRDFAHQIAKKTIDQDPAKMDDGSWDLSYRNLFLCEYYLLTQDKAVFPAINQLTIMMAQGQSTFGTFGHGLRSPTPDGKLHGSVPAYGPVNNTGLVVNIAILLGGKCGVNDPEVKPAIERASKFFGHYVERGAIPYGEHEAYPTHDNNGKNAMSAVFFALQPNRPEQARYFTKMTTASFCNREYGHTGQGLSYLWGALGANCGGPAALAGFFNQSSWHFDLERRCDGSFVYDGDEQFGPGATDDNTYYGKSSYDGLSPTATYVLTYSLPLRKLLITGRQGHVPAKLTDKDVAEAIASARFDLDRKNCTPEQLVAALGDWSPVARTWAAEELAMRPEAQSLVPKLIELANSANARQRLGACEALGRIQNPQALPVLIKLLKHDDHVLRFKAAEALNFMGDNARPALNQLLQALIDSSSKRNEIDWNDPLHSTQSKLAEAVFDGLLGGSIDDVDMKLLMPAIQAMLHNADGRGRGKVSRVLERDLTVDQVRQLGPDILLAIREIAPADTMFGNEIREAGLKVLAKYRFEEGLEAGLLFARTQSMHGSQERMGEIMKILASYGTAAKPLLPELRKLVDECKAQEDFPEWARTMKVKAVLDGIAAIEATTEQPKLLRLSEGNRPAK